LLTVVLMFRNVVSGQAWTMKPKVGKTRYYKKVKLF